MFEKYTTPALFLAKNAVCPFPSCAHVSNLYHIYIYINMIGGCHLIWYDSSSSCCQVLTSFASGRATSLVVDR